MGMWQRADSISFCRLRNVCSIHPNANEFVNPADSLACKADVLRPVARNPLIRIPDPNFMSHE